MLDCAGEGGGKKLLGLDISLIYYYNRIQVIEVIVVVMSKSIGG